MQPERFALHFQVPPVAHRPAPEFAVLGKFGSAVRPVDIAEFRPQRLQLFYERFERLADAAERGGTLLHQLELNASLTLRGFAATHMVIVPYDLWPIRLKADSTGEMS